MSSIFRYVVDMLPFMLLVIPIHVAVRIILLRRRQINLTREAALLIFVMFVAGLMSQTVIPEIRISAGEVHIINDGFHTTNLIPFRVLFDTYKELSRGHLGALIINFFGNVVMFMPIGFFVALLWKLSGAKVVLAGFLTSLFIEVTQLFLARNSDVDDLMLNTLGALFGLLIYKLLDWAFPKITAKFK